MTSAKIKGAVAPAGPLKTAVGNGGNYQIVSKAGSEKQIHAAGAKQGFAFEIDGTRRKGERPHWSSRAGRILAHKAKNISVPPKKP